MVCSARTLTGRVTVGAPCNTLVSVLGALEIWDRLGVIGSIGCSAVAADAIVVKGVLARVRSTSEEKASRESLTGSQLFASVLDADPGSWRQSNGQEAFCASHHFAVKLSTESPECHGKDGHTTRRERHGIRIDIVGDLSLGTEGEDGRGSYESCRGFERRHLGGLACDGKGVRGVKFRRLAASPRSGQ
jgi:hypothetical protein